MHPGIPENLWPSLSRHLGTPVDSVRAGRPPADDRRSLAGILYVLTHGIPWGKLPPRLGYGSGMTCLRRLRAWQESGDWPQIEAVLKQHLPHAKVDWQRAWQRRTDRKRPREKINDKTRKNT